MPSPQKQSPSSNVAKYTARDVAEYYLCCSTDKESGDLVSNLKLQKLVYYAQGIHLAAKGKPFSQPPGQEKTSSSRGEKVDGITIHSVRLPGLLAHQEDRASHSLSL